MRINANQLHEIAYGKVASPSVCDMILHESRPCLARRWCFPYCWQVFLDSSFAHPDPKLEQFTPNPLCHLAFNY